MYRVTDKQLNELIKKINELEGRPVEAYSYNETEKRYKANPKNLHLERRSSCYGAYSVTVFEMSNEGGGVSYFFNSDRYYKPAELLAYLRGYLSGKES